MCTKIDKYLNFYYGVYFKYRYDIMIIYTDYDTYKHL